MTTEIKIIVPKNRNGNSCPCCGKTVRNGKGYPVAYGSNKEIKRIDSDDDSVINPTEGVTYTRRSMGETCFLKFKETLKAGN